MSKLREVVEGWRNLLMPPKELAAIIEVMAEERITICRACPFDSLNAGVSRLTKDEHCTQCGCPLAAKVRSPTSQCPLTPPKWEPIMNLQEYETVNNQLNS